MRIVVTGGAGYIGSHTVISLAQQGHQAIIVDNLHNSSREVLQRLHQITGQTIPFYDADCRNLQDMQRIFDEHHVDAVIHFAALKAVGESVQKPLQYYQNNLESTLTVCRAMLQAGVPHLIFSSSATVYNQDAPLPWTETTPTGGTISHPYGQTKAMNERILRDIAAANPNFAVTILRYFNPIGAHPSGRIGEDPKGIPNNLLPYISQVAVGRRDHLQVFGGDWETPDGTCIRDYIHVVDVADGHVAALEHAPQPGTVDTYNLGSGQGTSVLQLVQAFEQASGQKIPYVIADRRAGDIGCFYADPGKANRQLGWRTQHTIQEACADTWHWQSANPHGYTSA